MSDPPAPESRTCDEPVAPSRGEMVKVKYCSNVTEATGYAEAARNLVAALVTAGADVSVQSLRIEGHDTDLSDAAGRLIRPLIGRRNGHAVKIVHTNPSCFTTEREPGVRNIGCTVWETDKLPRDWVDACNRMDEVWVPCRWNADVFRASGVTVPVRIVPHAIDLDALRAPGQPLPLEGLPDGAYVFYSVFQWSPRKNPEGLLKAYLSEFTPADDVCLLLKTHLSAHTGEERRELENRVLQVRRDMGMAHDQTPPVALLVTNLRQEEVVALHRRGDCLVLPHRAEGWGLPLLEAMALGKPVIATGFGGCLEFMTDENSYLLDWQTTPVCGMPWYRPYRGDQTWAEPDLGHLRRLMRHVYAHREEACRKGERAARDAAAFSWERVGRLMLGLLQGRQSPDRAEPVPTGVGPRTSGTAECEGTVGGSASGDQPGGLP